jgi:hypothetical protein
MLNKGEGYGSVFALLVIGGHSVAIALIDRQMKTAVVESFGVAACVIIFVILHALVKYVQNKGD